MIAGHLYGRGVEEKHAGKSRVHPGDVVRMDYDGPAGELSYKHS